ncbi:MAG: FtsX-like permease family protein [bacterium]|nr:FtsX-like permease family protein [bacterium]
MKKRNIIKSGFRVMGRYKLRTFFMMLGVVIGILSLTLVLALGKGTKQEMINKVERLFSASNILVNAGGTNLQERHDATGPAGNLTLEDMEALKNEITNIETYDPMQMLMGKSVKYKKKSLDLRIMGNSHTAEEVWNRSVVSGSFFTERENKQAARVALIGISVAETLFDGVDPIDENIRIGNVPFRVIGVLEPMGIDPHGLDRDNEIMVPITTAMRRLMNVDFITGAKLQLADKDKMDKTVAQINGILRDRHGLSGEEADDFSIITPVMVQAMIDQMNRLFSLFLPLVAGIALLAGGVVVTALMLISVNERKSEIGLRKALGARAKDILLQFMAETAVITVSGGFLGFLLGMGGVWLIIAKMKLPTIIPWEAFVLGMVFSAIVGMGAGIIPARRAAALDPVEAL